MQRTRTCRLATSLVYGALTTVIAAGPVLGREMPPRSSGRAAAPQQSGQAAAAQQPSKQDQARAGFVEALRLAENGKMQEALSTALRAAKLAPDDPDGLNLLGQIYEQLGRPDDAENAYLHAIRADPDWYLPYQNLGTLYLRRQEYAAALAPLQRAVETAPDNPLMHALLGAALRNTDRLDEAIKELVQAMQLDPQNPKAAIDVATAREEAGDLKGAIAAADRAVELDPHDRLALALLGRLLTRSDDADDLVRAPSIFRRAIEIEPERPQLWQGLAAAYNELALRDDAEQAQRRALELGLDTVGAHFNLAQILSRQQKFAAALEEYTRVIEREPGFGMAYYFRGEAYFNLNRVDDALADFRRAMQLLPGNPDPMLAAVQVLTVKGDLEGTDQVLQMALATGKMRPQVLQALARLRVRQGRNEEALEILDRIPADSPAYVEALYLKGQALIKLGQIEQGRATLAEYQKRFNAERGHEVEALRIGLVGRGQVYLLRTRVYLNEGRLELALEQAKAATELAPDNPDTWRALAQVQEARGDAEAAAQARDKAKQVEETVKNKRQDATGHSRQSGLPAIGSPGRA